MAKPFVKCCYRAITRFDCWSLREIAILLQGKRACSSKCVLTNVRRWLAPKLFEKEDMYEGVVVQGNYCNNIQQSESGGRPPGAALKGVGHVSIDRR
jgi:hypothetical protein